MRRLISAFAVACVCGGLPGAETLVSDAGFEAAASGRESAWPAAKGTYRYVAGEGRNGSAALRFDVKKGDRYVFPQQKVALEPGGRYRFEVWARTENLNGRGAGAALYAGWNDAGGRYLGGGSSESFSGTHGDWTLRTVTMDVPTNAATCSLGLYVTRSMTGTAWFDDVRVTRVYRPLLGPLVSSVYRETADRGRVTFSSALAEVLDGLSARGLSPVFSMPDKAGRVRTVAATVADDAVQATVDVASLPPGESEIGLRLIDGNGKAAETQTLSFHRVAAPASWPVRIDGHNRLIVDGKPFFPVGIYLSWFSDAALSDLAKSPFNCVMCYQRLTREQMDAFHEAGIKVICSIKDVYRGRPGCPKEITDAATEDAWVEAHVRSLADHPALLAWYVNDELGDAWIERLRHRYEIVRRADPGHPAFAVLCQVSSLRSHLGSFDVLGTDPYPVAGKEKSPISMVAKWTRMTRRAVFGGKPVWQVPQIFDWSAYKSWKGVTTRAPTEAEMRNMAWQCIAEGANGVVPYNYSGLKKMERRDPFAVQWDKVCRVYGEIRRHAPVLLSAEPPPRVSAAPEGVLVRMFRHGGEDWLLAVNTREAPVAVPLRIAGHGEVEVSLSGLGVEMRALGTGGADI